MWVAWPEYPKGANNEVKRPKEPPGRSCAPEGSYTSNFKMDFLTVRMTFDGFFAKPTFLDISKML